MYSFYLYICWSKIAAELSVNFSQQLHFLGWGESKRHASSRQHEQRLPVFSEASLHNKQKKKIRLKEN